jgi:glycosyltransferase involved in cell wall biosynthesis
MKTKTPVLVILTPGFAANEADSTCLPAQQNLILAINKAFPTIKILILSFQYPFARENYQWHGNKVMAFGGKNKGQLSRFIIWKRVWQQLKAIHKENTITGLLSFWCGECAFVANRFANKNQLQHFCWLLGQDAKADNHYVKRLDAGGENFIALSDFLQSAFLKNHGIRPAHVIPLGIAIQEYDDVIKEKDIDLLAAGSLIPLKQYEIFIEVVAALKKEWPCIKAQICGHGPELYKLQVLARDLSLQGNIIFTGERPHKEVLAAMQRTKIFLHPSAYEGFGMVCTEALYAGAQVISFCKPMQTPVPNWHIVKTKNEMMETVRALLNELPQPQQILPWSINTTAIELMKLFGHQG